MKNKLLENLIVEFRGSEDASEFLNFRLNTPSVVLEAAQEIMVSVPPAFGACASLSCVWADFLKEKYGIPAIVVAGDLEINGHKIFHCINNLPGLDKAGETVRGIWDGHCWIEIDGYIGDLSIFRTAYTLNDSHLLKSFIVENFGQGRGAILSPRNDLPSGMKYVPKFVLNDTQIGGMVAGLMTEIQKK